MFTGLIEATGKVAEVAGYKVAIETDLSGLVRGDSIAINGVCVTVVSSNGAGFNADLSEETLKRTTLGGLTRGTVVNLERPVPAGRPMGGHVVQGHVDGVARVVRIERLGGSVEIWFELGDGGLEKYLVEKGSVAVDGVSLTVTELDGPRFGVSLIPETLSATNLGGLDSGDTVNVEVDVLAKYVERLMEPYRPKDGPDGGRTARE